ncbi:MAG: hypothetical protein NC909_00945 [Candidatus Omnitrophica bacterium]|nr:hypothetical protein [Candidatus Omnitrophota bacterium]
MDSNKIRYTIKILLLFSTAFLIPIWITEIYLRIKGYRYLPLEIKILNKDDYRYSFGLNNTYFTYDPYLIWRPKKNVLFFNSQGYKGKDLSLQKDDIRIFVFGDSNVLGFPKIDDFSWPEYLQELLGKQFTVINAGVWRYTTFQGLRYFKDHFVFYRLWY